MKYGIKSESGGGRSSARETIARVLGGALADQYMESQYKIQVVSWVNSVGNISIPKNI